MQALTSHEIFYVFGRGSFPFLVATSHIHFDGENAACIESYLNEHQSDIVGLSLADLVKKIMLQCCPKGSLEYKDSLIALEP